MQRLTQLPVLPSRHPLYGQWELTCRCNLRCVMCYTDCFNHPEYIRQELSTQEILRILDELTKAGCLELCFTGGEPLARTDFFTIYEQAISNGLLVTLFTNGTLITEAVADRLAIHPPKQIEISVHGATEQTFERVTQGHGSYRRVQEAIGMLRARQLPLTLKTTAMTVNTGEVLSIKRAVQSMGTVAYKLGDEMRPALDGSLKPLELGLTSDERASLFQEDRELWSELCARETATIDPCRSGEHKFHIDAYGMLQLCSGNRQQGYDLRKGSFREGFYNHLTTFPCRWKVAADSATTSQAAAHV
jgi:MoaA/NifB/PqqE/SkfB family radical SAM enzyme